MSDNIKVVVKLRPLISREIEEKQQHHWRVNNNTLSQLDGNGRDYGQTFTFGKRTSFWGYLSDSSPCSPHHV